VLVEAGSEVSGSGSGPVSRRLANSLGSGASEVEMSRGRSLAVEDTRPKSGGALSEAKCRGATTDAGANVDMLGKIDGGAVG
jgi:hypothetical protein